MITINVIKIIKNTALVLAIAIGIPILVHSYISYFYPTVDSTLNEEIQKLELEINQLNEKKNSEKSQLAKDKIQNNIDRLNKEVNQKKDSLLNPFLEARKQYNTNVFIIMMAAALIFILLGTFFPNNILQAAFTLGGLFLLINGYFYSWIDLNSLLRVISMTIWFIILILIIIYRSHEHTKGHQ